MKEHSVEINNFLVGYENHISPSLMSALIHRMNQSSDFLKFYEYFTYEGGIGEIAEFSNTPDLHAFYNEHETDIKRSIQRLCDENDCTHIEGFIGDWGGFGYDSTYQEILDAYNLSAVSYDEATDLRRGMCRWMITLCLDQVFRDYSDFINEIERD